jgi:hypothetical protein
MIKLLQVGGLMYRGKLILWTFFELINVTTRDIVTHARWPEISASFIVIFKRVVFQVYQRVFNTQVKII